MEKEQLDLLAKALDVLTMTEIGGQTAIKYKFSYAEKGKSAYSFK